MSDARRWFQFSLARMAVATLLVGVGLGSLALFASAGRAAALRFPDWVYLQAFISAPAFVCAGIGSLMPKSSINAVLAGVAGWILGFFLGFPLFAIWALVVGR